jgi:DNA-binding IclR family transcriptional regulator
MKTNIGFKIYSLFGMLETKHNLTWADGLHRQVFMAVLEAQNSGVDISNQQIVEKGFTSRSSTYRKIADLRQLGFLSEKWNNSTCNLELGPAALELIRDADVNLRDLLETTD